MKTKKAPNKPDLKVGVVFWDWKAQPDWGEINRLLRKTPNPMVLPFEIGDDNVWIAIVSRDVRDLPVEQVRRAIAKEADIPVEEIGLRKGG